MNSPRAIPATGLAAPRKRGAEGAAALLPAPAARLVGFCVLASFGAVQWGRLLAPAAGAAMLAALVSAVLAGWALAAVARARPSARRRWAAGALAAAALLLVALLGARAPAGLLVPRHWDDLARGIGDGLSAVSTITVPYRGAEQWTRTVLVLGGAALIGLAALLAFAPRRDGRFGYPIAAAVALGTLYAAPVIQRHADRPFASGLVFALALALFLWLERVERRSTMLAAGVVAAAAFAGVLAAPVLDAGAPLLDYEQLAQSLSGSKTTQYSWNHSYGKLDWPRDGREVLRVSSPRRAYWKAVNLTSFDGLRWVQDVRRPGDSPDVAQLRADWVQSIDVTIRALRSPQFIGAGTTLRIGEDRGPAAGTPPGVLQASGRVLARGESYRALVYVPRPTTRQMRAAGTAYPFALHADYGFLRVPFRAPGIAAEQVVPIAFWGEAASAGQPDVATSFEGSPYAGVYAIASRLRAQAATPYDFMRAVERFLVRGFGYSETPPPSRTPLADFILRDKVGYCQQFSGAMALMLRMGGVPARVSAGFAPGALDDKGKQYVVRDIDAHSWVEVYFPKIGWVTRDPTPAASPARSQSADLAASSGASDLTLRGGGSERTLGGSTDRGRAAAPAAAVKGGGSADWLLVIAAAAGALLLAALAIMLRRRRRGAAPSQDELVELRRALRRSGRDAQPDLTLEALAGRFAGTAAEGYVRVLTGTRYGYGSAAPSPRQRAALRTELAAGLGLRGRLRSWWALPPGTPRGVLSSMHGRRRRL
ncbi:MAG: protein-glutamine gamma-glutamyltransferase [Solirubrobacteraceae bacterium]|nr:protein-glutamine gamma-glutamyltransferase [Solirubrobacteraceae bacterium]